MVEADIKPALRIITAHDRDDGEAAAESYLRSLAHQYALLTDEEVVGVTGGLPIEGTVDAWWLSWTYLDRAARGRGLGREMLGRMLDVLRRRRARKVFLTTSDLRGRDGEPKYGAALRAYAAAGFEHEARHADFYTPGEAMLVMGKRLRAKIERAIPHEPRGIRVVGADEIAETDDTYALDWRFTDDGPGDDAAALRSEVERLREDEARVVYLGLPTDARAANALAEAAGFTDDGRLLDFYDDGVDEVRWRVDVG